MIHLHVYYLFTYYLPTYLPSYLFICLPVCVSSEGCNLLHARVAPYGDLVQAVAVSRHDLVDVRGPHQIADLDITLMSSRSSTTSC
jgi:glycine cleavage system regulatory protein